MPKFISHIIESIKTMNFEPSFGRSTSSPQFLQNRNKNCSQMCVPTVTQGRPSVDLQFWSSPHTEDRGGRRLNTSRRSTTSRRRSSISRRRSATARVQGAWGGGRQGYGERAGGGRAAAAGRRNRWGEGGRRSLPGGAAGSPAAAIDGSEPPQFWSHLSSRERLILREYRARDL
jgi:hypothetical protein